MGAGRLKKGKENSKENIKEAELMIVLFLIAGIIPT